MKYIYSLLIASIILFSCKKDETTPQPPPTVTPTSDTTITVGSVKYYYVTIKKADWHYDESNRRTVATISIPVLTNTVLPYCKVDGAILRNDEWKVLPWYVSNSLITNSDSTYTLDWLNYNLFYGAGYIKIVLDAYYAPDDSFYNIKARIAVSL
ncbi:MAG: hypothetical protein J0I41_10765 [Filimonas sp.]|nr:hypothetical protein [Filimonas sp.]